ncbi:unnamed protein product [Cercopithifilaria johnstoni]|uniref:Atos-like conserved domain-containing protein n=1 Tax=Cercopithifilaria johnstoni TaxID=2874296 RepID=A0A8J2M1U0_9BILA|nr:unnamed protein product [Cercopithifilaria johnstoni]
MELSLEIARLVIDSRENSKCSEQMFQKAREIIETGSLLSIHTFIVHRQCCLKFSPCTGVVLLEEWTIKIVPRESTDDKALDSLFLKNAIRSYLHFSQLSSGVTCTGEQLSNDAICKYRVFVDDVCLDDQLRIFEVHEFPRGQLNPLLCVYVAVKWRKCDDSSYLSSYSESTRLFCDEWPLFSTAFSREEDFTASPSGISFFHVPIECQQNNEEKKMKSEDVGNGSVATFKTSYDLKIISCEQLLIKDNCNSQFFNFRRDIKEKMLLRNEQIVKLPVVGSLLSSSASSTETGSLLQAVPTSPASRRETLPRRSLMASAFRFMSTASKAFSKTTGLPLNSSPAPFNRSETKGVKDQLVKSSRDKIAKKTAKEGTRTHILRNVSTNEKDNNSNYCGGGCTRRSISSSSGLLCNFEESALNGRLDLVMSLDGFHLQIAASDETCSPHLTLPVTTFFFNMPEDEAPLPYMGFCSLENMRKGYRIPRKGILQAVLFNPQGTVVRMFVVKFDVSDMPPSSQTFLRQRTFFMPVGCTYDGVIRSWLKYLIHLSLATDRRGRLYVHTDIKMLFSQKNELETLNFELGKDMIKYQLQSFTEMPRNPKYSPRK